MKSLKILMLCSAIVFVSACNNDNDDDTEQVSATVPSFSEFARDVFAQSANTEPKTVKSGVTFKVTNSDNSTDFSDLIN